MKLPWRAVLLSGMAAILVIGVSGALLLPRLIDSQMIKNRISSELVKKTTVTVTFDKIALLWFPWPSVVIENAELSFADKNQGSIRTLRIYPSIFYLLTGRLVVRRALLQEPNFRIHLPERFEKPFDLEELEKQIRSALARFTRDFPAPIDIDDGSAEIRIDDKPAVILENVAAQTVGSPAELRFELSARSNLCEHLKIEGKISPQSLASQLDIGLQRLKIKDSLALLPSQIFEYVRQGEASLDVKMASVGLRKLKASVRGSVGRLVFAWHGPTVTTEAKSVKGEMTYEDGVVQVDVEQLNLGAPRLQASGQLKVRAGSLSARIRLRDVDIAEVRDMALRTVGDVEGVKRIFLYVPAGKIPDMSIEAAGRSVADMASVKNMVVSAVMRNGKIFIPSPALELKDVSGSVRI
ncbi:MAG TPA: DUF748 domain-containing protein, partial [Candidatus Acidoferrales bacterium]|nr:DUF748 domain-containing protein [Candidatus Acidoferrales bacterium]